MQFIPEHMICACPPSGCFSDGDGRCRRLYKAAQDRAEGVARDVDRQRGLYGKYRVERNNDPAGKHKDCEYFVLDLVHDKHAIAGLSAYADSCEHEYPLLARDLRSALSKAKGRAG